MRSRFVIRRLLLLACIGASVGCNALLIDADKPLPVGSPLRAAEASPDGVRFEVYWATLPPDAEVDGQASLWRFVQEERLDETLRGRLRRNGLRAGVVGGVPPKAIAKLLNPRPDLAKAAGEGSISALATATGVKQQEMTIRPGEPALVNASEVEATLSLLLAEDGSLPVGETFERVQAVYRVGVQERRGGGHTISVGPELHFGEARMRYVAAGSAGITRAKPLREERAFPDLRIEADLIVGEMLMVTSLPESDSRLGGFFHRADGEVSGARKAIVVRLIQAPPSADFAAERRGADRPEF